jgi:hypothetical protein
VLSIATWVTPLVARQSASWISSSVIVPKLRTSFTGWPLDPGMTRHATTVRLWISSPQHRSNKTSIVASSARRSRGGVLFSSVCCACLPDGSNNRWCLRTPRPKLWAGSRHQAPADPIHATVDRAGYLRDRRFSSTGGGSQSHEQVMGTGFINVGPIVDRPAPGSRTRVGAGHPQLGLSPHGAPGEL